MPTTVLALFRERQEAEAAIRALRSAHFDSARLGLAPPGQSRVPRYGAAAFRGVLAGAAGCAVVGAVIGLFAAGLVPLVPAWLPGGWLVPLMLCFAGAGTGAVAGLLMSQSAIERGAYYYDDEVRAGRAMVIVQAEAAEVAEARRILLLAGAFDAAPIDAPTTRRGFAD